MTDSILITIKQLLGLNAYRTELEKYESLIVYECDPHYE